MQYSRISPYSGVVINVEVDPSNENGLPIVVQVPAIPLIFKPSYPEPLPVGAKVPY